jgi:predicted ArsR family transcriptional regulator
MSPDRSRDAEIARLATLEDPLRRRLYDLVARSSEPVGREQAAAVAGIGRTLAAYHLDKLVEQGLLTASYRRPEGRAGPGAGRPAKLYARAEREVAVSVPPREYELAAGLLADAAEEDETGAARERLHEVAERAGRLAGAALPRSRSIEAALRERGYEPFRDEGGVLRARNCPFHNLAAEHRDLVCGMNVAFVKGLLEGLDTTGPEVRLDPHPGRCCVTVVPRPAAR